MTVTSSDIGGYINGLTEESSPDTANDMLLLRDATDGSLKKIAPTTIASGGTVGHYGTQILNTTAGAGGAASFSASGIATDYDFIKIFIQGKSAAAATSDTVLIALNSDTTDSNYYRQYLYGADTTPSANEAASRVIGSIGGSSNAYNVGQIEFMLINPGGTTFQKTGHGTSINHTTTTQSYLIHSGINWLSTSAITAITLTCAGGNFAEGTTCVIVGYKNNA